MMRGYRFLALGSALVFLTACDSTTPGADCQQATLEAQAFMDSQISAVGQVSGFINGQMTFEITQRQEHADGTETLQTRHTFVTADGEGEIRTQDTATLGPMQADHTRTVEAQLTIQNGTGTFAGATGSLTADGMVDYLADPSPALTGTYTGQICF